MFRFSAILNNAAIYIYIKFLFYLVSIPFGMYPEWNLWVIWQLILRNCQTLPKELHQVINPTASYEGSHFMACGEQRVEKEPSS